MSIVNIKQKLRPHDSGKEYRTLGMRDSEGTMWDMLVVLRYRV